MCSIGLDNDFQGSDGTQFPSFLRTTLENRALVYKMNAMGVLRRPILCTTVHLLCPLSWCLLSVSLLLRLLSRRCLLVCLWPPFPYFVLFDILLSPSEVSSHHYVTFIQAIDDFLFGLCSKNGAREDFEYYIQ